MPIALGLIATTAASLVASVLQFLGQKKAADAADDAQLTLDALKRQIERLQSETTRQTEYLASTAEQVEGLAACVGVLEKRLAAVTTLAMAAVVLAGTAIGFALAR